MLKSIIFCIKYQTDVTISEKIAEASSYLKEEGYDSRVVYPDEALWNKDSLLLGVMEDNDEDNLGDILFMVDCDEFADILLRSGAYVVGIAHEENGSDTFLGVKYVFSEIDQVDADSYEKAYQRYAHLPWKILETDRLSVRETTVEDVDSFYELYADPEMTRYMEGLFADPEDEKKYTKDYIDKVYGLLGFGVWTVIHKESGNIIGRAGFSIRNGFDGVELGFLIGTKYQKQGYAYEACRAVLDYGRDVLLFPKVQTFVKRENLVSIHLCEKLGFVKTGEADIEENIYGDEYNDGERVSLSSAHYGKYVKMEHVF